MVDAAEPVSAHETQAEPAASTIPAPASTQSTADFMIPASVLMGMDDGFPAPVKHSSVAEAVHAAAMEAAMEASAAQIAVPVAHQPTPVAAASAVVTAEPARERRRAPNDPRNRLPQ